MTRVCREPTPTLSHPTPTPTRRLHTWDPAPNSLTSDAPKSSRAATAAWGWGGKEGRGEGGERGGEGTAAAADRGGPGHPWVQAGADADA